MASIKKARAKSNKRTTKINPDLDFLVKVGDTHSLVSSEFRRCAMSTYDGVVTQVNFSDVKANMRCGLYILECKPEQPAEKLDQVYDIVTLQKKVSKEKHEKMEEDRLAKIKTCGEIIDADTKEIDVHKDKLEEFKQIVGCDLTDEAAIKEAIAQGALKAANIAIDTSDAIIEGIKARQEMIVELNERILQTKDFLEKLQEPTIERPLSAPADTNIKDVGNKHARALHKKLCSKFTLQKRVGVTYVEFQFHSAIYLINNAHAYVFTIPCKNSDKTYFVIYGDLCSKIEFMRSIDPTYGTEEALAEQKEALDRLRKIETVGSEVEDEPAEQEHHPEGCSCSHHHDHDQHDHHNHLDSDEENVEEINTDAVVQDS
jgi:hypothetical protein